MIHYAAFEKASNEFQDMRVSDPSRHFSNELVVRDFVEARFDVSLNHPSVSGSGVTERVQGLNTIHRTASWPKSIGEVEEICFPDGFHEHFQQGLNGAVFQGGYP